MNRPGTRLRALAVRLFDPSTLERLIDPVIADLQCEHADAVRHGQLWRARWVRIASGIAFGKVAAVAVVATNRHGARAIAVALTAATPLMILATCLVLAGTAATIHTRESMVWLVLYLVPQALAISLPVSLALGVFVWIRGEGVGPSTKRTVLWLMRLALLLAVANTGWITPAANTAYRNVNAGAAMARGANELTFIELGQRVYQGDPETALDDPLPMTFWLNARLALAIAPALLCVLALAGATALRRRSSAVIVVSTLAAFAGCYLLFPAEQIALLARWLPVAAIAWIPDMAVAVATISLARRMPVSWT
jgi:lipopolysaccharide export LptBFGC system permease protein LptF